MIILIPLGGTGSRFKSNGYRTPKALINIFGKPIIYYLLDNLNTKHVDFVYIPYNKEYVNFRLEDRLRKDYPDIKFKFYALQQNTEGAAETINIALRNICVCDQPILCLDSDNFYTADIVSLWNKENKIITFEDSNESPIYSYIKIENGKVLDIVEKTKISEHACTGAYGFNSCQQLLTYTQKILDNKIKQNGEYYTSTVIKEMIKDDIAFTSSVVESKDYVCLGTPIQIRYFCNNYPKYSCPHSDEKIKNLRICFDLDNTLVTFPTINKDYASVKPVQKNIDILRYLKRFGHTIIIYTARRMKTHHGNTGKALADVGKITFDTLEKFDIPYDEIYFGKPQADFYIDDLAINCFDDIERLLGFYSDTINPRDFNEINTDTIQAFTKRSDDLSGEIHYYLNIPKEIKDMFPILINYDADNKWYTMEKIDGISCSTLYLAELLTLDHLKHIMNSIKRIHSVNTEESTIDIYQNYTCKLKDRYDNYDYSIFDNYDKTYRKLMQELSHYEENNKGSISVIHGDTVLTNIIINKYEKIKFIDMRGKAGKTLTIYGDWLYDWAKLYQSLIGYDKILQGNDVSKKYESGMKEFFKEYFIELYSLEDFDNLILITKSLLFTLIPLHDNEKCQDYYNLIFTI